MPVFTILAGGAAAMRPGGTGKLASILGPVLLGLALTACSIADSAPNATRAQPLVDAKTACAPFGTSYLRTTLYFGLARPSGVVSDANWQSFLRDEITPRFPDGLTVWEADGQWR